MQSERLRKRLANQTNVPASTSSSDHARSAVSARLASSFDSVTRPDLG
jgi:hypothetical protein